MLGDAFVTTDGVGDGERKGVLPASGEKVGTGLATATGEALISIEGVGAVDVGARPHAAKTTTSPTITASAIWRPRVSDPNLSGRQV